MQIHFFIRGQKECVDIVLNWLNTRMIMIPYWPSEKQYKAGKKPTMTPNSHILRYSVGGSYELIVPEQEADKWLTTLGFDQPLHPDTLKMRLGVAFLRKAMGLKKPKEFKTDEKVMLPLEYVKHLSFIPIGVKYDIFRQLDDGFHEAL